MVIDEWLHRLNLLELKPEFENQKIRRVQDLMHINDAGLLEEFGKAD